MDRDSILHFAARCKIKSKIVEINDNLSDRPLDFDRFFVKSPNPSAPGNSCPKPVPSRRPAAGNGDAHGTSYDGRGRSMTVSIFPGRLLTPARRHPPGCPAGPGGTPPRRRPPGSPPPPFSGNIRPSPTALPVFSESSRWSSHHNPSAEP